MLMQIAIANSNSTHNPGIKEGEDLILEAFRKIGRVPIWVSNDGDCLKYSVLHSLQIPLIDDRSHDLRKQIQLFCIMNQDIEYSIQCSIDLFSFRSK
jgi:hypothetical protein